MAVKKKFEKIRRFIRTLHFLIVMVASLLILWLPVLVSVGDVLVPCVLLSSFTCVGCFGFREHWDRYEFRSSLIDVPVVSALRSFVITCVYMMYDSPVLSHGQYLGTVTLCSIFSILVLSVKACVFTVNSELEAEASSSLSKQRLQLKRSWGMNVLFLSSVVFALGHIVIAYRTSCRARRKLMFNRIDPDSVFLSQFLFSIGFAKLPRSSTHADMAQKSDNVIRRKPHRVGLNHGELPIRLLADVDSLFMVWHGLTVHYKLNVPNPPCRTLSSTTLLENPSSTSSPKTPHHLRRSFSIQIQDSSLYAPLLDGTTSPIFSDEMPFFTQDEESNEYFTSKSVSRSSQKGFEVNRQFGVVLVHGFGGGVFSWRHIMAVLSRQVNCIVASFDRPGWGLTSRPRREEWEATKLPNPYMMDTQVDMLISFCKEMGLSSVVLVGHDDGGLLALKAAQRLGSSANSVDVEIKGVVLLTVSLSREVVPGLARILMRTSLGKKNLVHSLLRTEICQVVNRKAWYDATKLTTDVLSLYKAPLCVEGWDEALYEIGKLSSDTVLSEQSASVLVKAVEDIPVMVIAGAEDALVPLKSVQTMASKFVNSVSISDPSRVFICIEMLFVFILFCSVPLFCLSGHNFDPLLTGKRTLMQRLVAISGCGHLPHEECPKVLLAAILPFISKLTSKADK
ncbi:alpha/beta hydrolases superfamily protein [Tanacetum coccineum]